MDFSTISGLITKQFTTVSDVDCYEYIIRALAYISVKSNGLSCTYTTNNATVSPSDGYIDGDYRYAIAIPVDKGLVVRSIDRVLANGIPVSMGEYNGARSSACHRRYEVVADNIIDLFMSYPVDNTIVTVQYTCTIDLESPPCSIPAAIGNKYFEAILAKASSFAAARLGELKLSQMLATDADRNIRTMNARSISYSPASYTNDSATWLDRK